METISTKKKGNKRMGWQNIAQNPCVHTVNEKIKKSSVVDRKKIKELRLGPTFKKRD